MPANPHIDQLAAQTRDRIAQLPPELADKMARYICDHLHTELSCAVPDEVIGAVLLSSSGAVFGLIRDFQLEPIGIGNALAIGGEHLYRSARRNPFTRKDL